MEKSSMLTVFIIRVLSLERWRDFSWLVSVEYTEGLARIYIINQLDEKAVAVALFLVIIPAHPTSASAPTASPNL
jgi:hypothetical protein